LSIYGVISTGGSWIWNPNAAATATSTGIEMNVISATGIEPAADLRKALAERKRASLLPLVVQGDNAAAGELRARDPWRSICPDPGLADACDWAIASVGFEPPHSSAETACV